MLRGLLVLLACAAVAGAYLRAREPGQGSSAGTVHVRFAYSSNLDEMMATLIPQFNDGGLRVNGQRVVVDGVSASSGDVLNKIVGGQLRPDAWSPASSLSSPGTAKSFILRPTAIAIAKTKSRWKRTISS